MYDIVKTKHGMYVLMRRDGLVIDSSKDPSKLNILERDIEKRLQKV